MKAGNSIDTCWLALKPYRSFKDDWYLKDILPRISETAFFFHRKDDQTRIILRTNNFEKTLFQKIDQLEASEISQPRFVFNHVKRLRLKKHHAIPIVLQEQRSQLYKIFEQIHGGEECVVACYAKKDPAGASLIWSWITSRETKSSQGTLPRPQLKSNIELARQKVKNTELYQCEIFFGVRDKKIFDLLKMTVPAGISRAKTIPQKKFSLRKRRFVENYFPFATYHPKKPLLSSKTFPILNTAELLSIVSFPDDVSKFRMEFGSYMPYSQGHMIQKDDTEIPRSDNDDNDDNNQTSEE